MANTSGAFASKMAYRKMACRGPPAATISPTIGATVSTRPTVTVGRAHVGVSGGKGAEAVGSPDLDWSSGPQRSSSMTAIGDCTVRQLCEWYVRRSGIGLLVLLCLLPTTCS